MINDTLRKWISDSIAYNFGKDYGVPTNNREDFLIRQDDFYITLINKFFDIIKNPETISEDKEDLLSIAHGMAVYSRISTKGDFYGVEVNRNMLYVCSALYLCDYPAIASLFSKQIDRSYIENHSQATSIYLLSGGNAENIEADPRILNYVNDGNQKQLLDVLKELDDTIDNGNFQDADAFFDCYVCRAIVFKFNNHNIWKDLTNQQVDIDWHPYIQLSIDQHILSFLPSQLEALEQGLLTFENSFSLKMPTSAGKSYLTQLVIYEELQRDKKAHILYIAPLRSLSFELKKKYRRIASVLGFTMESAYGGLDNVKIDEISDKNLLITTPETLMALEGALDGFLETYSLIICDEGQLLDSFKRGINYELLLTRLRKMNGKRFLFISAIIPNIDEVNEWLGGNKESIADSDYRPCKVRLGIGYEKDNNISVGLLDNNFNHIISEINPFVAKSALGEYNLSKKIQCNCALALQSLKAGPVILYTQSNKGNSGTTAYGKKMIDIIENTTLPIPLEFVKKQSRLKDIHEYISYQIGSEHLLCNCIKRGFAYHNGSLPQDFREIFESAFNQGVLHLLISTSTLSEGVNMPVKTIVLGYIFEFGEDQKPHLLDRMRLKNITGRAGRAGREDYGTVLIMDNKKYVIDEVRSALRGNADRKIRGTLYDIVKYLGRFGDELSDEQISKALEESDLAWAIDLMIERNSTDDSVEDIDISEIVNDTLAYFLGNDTVKDMLKRVFSLRLKAIKDGTGKNYKYFHDSGMDLKLFESTDDYFKSHSIKFLRTPDINDKKWFQSFIFTLMDFGGINFRERDIDKNNVVDVLWLWIQGCQYNEIADSLSIDVDKIIELVSDFTRGIPISRIKSVVRYLNSKYNIETTEYDKLFRYIKYGFNSDWKVELKRQFPNMDRISVNFIVDSLAKNNVARKVFNHEDINLIALRKEIMQILIDAEIPNISKNIIARELKITFD